MNVCWVGRGLCTHSSQHKCSACEMELYCVVPLTSSKSVIPTIVSWQNVTATGGQTVWWTKLLPTVLRPMTQRVGKTRGTLVWYASQHDPCHMQTELSCGRYCSCKCRQHVRLWFLSREIQRSPLMDFKFPLCLRIWVILIESSYGSPTCMSWFEQERLDTTSIIPMAYVDDIWYATW